MTEEGYAVLVAAAPDHVANVRSLVYEGLDEQDVADLKRLMTHILQRIETSGLKSTC